MDAKGRSIVMKPAVGNADKKWYKSQVSYSTMEKECYLIVRDDQNSRNSYMVKS